MLRHLSLVRILTLAIAAGVSLAAASAHATDFMVYKVSLKVVAQMVSPGPNFDVFLTKKLGNNDVIKGWDQGLVGVPVGSRVQLDIPTDLAYGPTPPSGYPAGPLRFVIDILSAK